jgi:hypothetical protein
MKRRSLAVAATLLVLGTMTAGCTTPADPATSVSGAPATAPGSAAPGSRLVWRGAVLTLDPGWRRVISDQEQLCLQAETNPDVECGLDRTEDLIYLYASERSGGAEGEPGHASSLDAAGMDSFTWDGGFVPCDFPDEPPLRKGTRPVGGRTAFYGEWRLACTDRPAVLVQRWVLPKSRLGVLSYASGDASAKRIEQMVAAMDLSHFTPTSPSPASHN